MTPPVDGQSKSVLTESDSGSPDGAAIVCGNPVPWKVYADLLIQLVICERERDELIAALERIADTACGEESNQYIAIVALEKLSGDKKGEKDA